MEMVKTDARSRVVLPGHSDEMFLMRENPDGSILLEPAVVVSTSQLEYDQNPGVAAFADGGRRVADRRAHSPKARTGRWMPTHRSPTSNSMIGTQRPRALRRSPDDLRAHIRPSRAGSVEVPCDQDRGGIHMVLSVPGFPPYQGLLEHGVATCHRGRLPLLVQFSLKNLSTTVR